MKQVLLYGMSVLISAGNYEEYNRFLQEQSKNETFVKLFELHTKKFQGENYKVT
jgi:hypothetical protein